MDPTLQQYGLAGLVISSLASVVTTLSILLHRSWSARVRDKDAQIKQLSEVLSEKEGRIQHLEDQRAEMTPKIFRAIDLLKGKRSATPPSGTQSQREPTNYSMQTNSTTRVQSSSQLATSSPKRSRTP